MEITSSVWSKSSRETVPLPMPIDCGRPTLVDSDTCWSNRGSCWCHTRGQTAGTATPLRWRLGQRCRIQPHPAAGRGGSRRYGRRLAPTPPGAGYRCPGRKPKDGLSGRSPPVQNRFCQQGRYGICREECGRHPFGGRLPVTALAPFSQNWKVDLCSLSGGQPGQSNRPAGWYAAAWRAPQRHPSGCARRWPWPSTRPPACRTVIGEHREPRVFIGHLFTPAALFWLSLAEKGVRQPRRRSVNRMASPERMLFLKDSTMGKRRYCVC